MRQLQVRQVLARFGGNTICTRAGLTGIFSATSADTCSVARALLLQCQGNYHAL